MKLKTYLIPLAVVSSAVAVNSAFAASVASHDGNTLDQAEARLGEAVTAAKHFVRSAYAQMTDANDAIAVEQAGITLSQAIAAAEQHIGGQASRAEFELDDGLAAYNVEVIKAGEVTDVMVDAMNGRIVEAHADGIDCRNDRDGAREERDD
ncbi:MAG: PepSY domain-containing protein [Gammaproteobacteria bacterium]|nr:PepSY domain-containing protein [Gammaproteobacteria bacterium]MCP5137078.1 PepSY domain-containing protein [Gammaproteobacteria bacterium]